MFYHGIQYYFVKLNASPPIILDCEWESFFHLTSVEYYKKLKKYNAIRLIGGICFPTVKDAEQAIEEFYEPMMDAMLVMQRMIQE